MKCLLVDDEPGIREGLAALLRRKGHDVRTAADCAGAAAALAGDTFDVVVSDWRLPDGLAAAFVADCGTPVLAVSGHPEEVQPLPSIHAVLTKPVSPTRLLEAMTSASAMGPARAVATPSSLAPAVQAVVDIFVAALPRDAVVDLHDDGTFVTVSAALPPGPEPVLPPFDGDLRRTRRGAQRGLELRLWRELTPRRPGPASSQGTAHDMPMRDPVGPCVQAELADLWSQP
ncbi:MAG: response regulator [Planctomycetes bacterium]|jgi:CheY-like chemotaxis protein|nr:response regulator [Planctomycetota bacterium]